MLLRRRVVVVVRERDDDEVRRRRRIVDERLAPEEDVDDEEVVEEDVDVRGISMNNENESNRVKSVMNVPDHDIIFHNDFYGFYGSPTQHLRTRHTRRPPVHHNKLRPTQPGLARHTQPTL